MWIMELLPVSCLSKKASMHSHTLCKTYVMQSQKCSPMTKTWLWCIWRLRLCWGWITRAWIFERRSFLCASHSGRHARQKSQHQEVELLLENYFKQMQDVLHQVNQSKNSIKAVEDLINIRLDSWVFDYCASATFYAFTPCLFLVDLAIVSFDWIWCWVRVCFHCQWGLL